MVIEAALGRGESNTPFPEKICNTGSPPVYVVAGAGVDQIRIVLSLSGESAELCRAFTEHDYRPRGMPNMRMVGSRRQDGFKRTFSHFLGEDAPRLLYHRDSATLHVDVHFSELVAVPAAVERAAAVVTELSHRGVETPFVVRIARADITGDVLFSSAAYFRYVFSAFRSMLCEWGRVVEPFRSSTLYVNASTARHTKRLGRIYDKGLERAAEAGWDIPPERYLRIEAERLWDADRPPLAEFNAAMARAIFLDRFGAVGRGTVLLKGGLVEPLMTLLRAETISSGQYERLYTFLDHSRMGLARDLYGRDTYLRRARESRALGLEVPGADDRPAEDLEHDLDVRALVHEIARGLTVP
jgi:hypothetical protein